MPEIETNCTELTAEEVAALVADAPACAEGGGSPHDPAAFVPTDAAGVDWVLKQMADARSRAERIRANAEKMARAEERNAEFLEWKFGAALQAYVRAELEGGNKKSVRLYHGQLGFRTKPATVLVTNFASALEWAKDNLPGAGTVALERKVLAAKLLEAAVVPDFAEIVPAEEVFFIK